MAIRFFAAAEKKRWVYYNRSRQVNLDHESNRYETHRFSPFGGAEIIKSGGKNELWSLLGG